MMSPFPSSSESRQPHAGGESLSEAVFDSSSVRKLIPEKYHEHLDELLENIRAFCREFDIPNDALRSVETFGTELTSKKIPPKRMAEAVSLFESLHGLVSNPEYFEEAEHLYNLKEQYAFQFNFLKEVGILNERNAIVGVDGREYPVPTLEQIAQRLHEREKDLSIKRDQGFMKLLLVPFGMSFDVLCGILRRFLLAYKKDHPDFNLNTKIPLQAAPGYEETDLEDPPPFVYHPESFDKDHHQGQTKLGILRDQSVNKSSSFCGWRVHFFQPSNPGDQGSGGIAFIPRKGQGKVCGEENPRADFEAGKAPNDYLSILQKAKEDFASPYHGESGLTPEDWILAFMTHLIQTGEPLDYYDDKRDSITSLIGVFCPSISLVPVASWYHGWKDTPYQVDLIGNNPDTQVESVGVRTSVIV